MSMATAVSFSQGMGPLALAPMFPQLIEAFDSDLASVVQFTGVCILVLGFSNFIWYTFWRIFFASQCSKQDFFSLIHCRVPMQTAFGRRPVLLASTMICLVSNVWRAVAKDYRSFMGACILNGIGAGVAEVCNEQLGCEYLLADTCCRQLSQLSLQT